jgi:hypothetical protein
VRRGSIDPKRTGLPISVAICSARSVAAVSRAAATRVSTSRRESRDCADQSGWAARQAAAASETRSFVPGVEVAGAADSFAGVPDSLSAERISPTVRKRAARASR